MRTPFVVWPFVFALPIAFATACSSETVIVQEPAAMPEAGQPAPLATEGDAGGVDEQDAGTVTVPGPDASKPPKDAGVDAPPFVEAPHTQQFPQIPANNAEVLQPLKLVTIVTPADALATDLFAFSDALVESNWWKAVGKDYGLTTATSVNIQATEAITGSPTQTFMDSYIGRAIVGHPDAADDGNTMYLLYLPEGMVDTDAARGVNTNCKFHGGYHTVGNNGRYWGVGMRCPTQGTGLSKLQSLTVIGSHEIIEAASDPYPGRGWTLGPLTSLSQSPWASTQGENGDMCVSTQVTEGFFTYQRVWSNTAAKAGGDPCVPPVSTPYYNVSTAKDWYKVAPGGTVTIPLNGWSTARMLDWVVDGAVQVEIPENAGFTAKVTSATSQVISGTSYFTVNNAGQATLTVTAPNTSNAAAVVWVISQPRSPSVDPYHFLPIGIYTQ